MPTPKGLPKVLIPRPKLSSLFTRLLLVPPKFGCVVVVLLKPKAAHFPTIVTFGERLNATPASTDAPKVLKLLFSVVVLAAVVFVTPPV